MSATNERQSHDFTGDQLKAIAIHDKNLVVTAGAGSGKTRVLVERYLRLLEANPDWLLSSLVAITFTRAAAAEMRDRVRTELETRLRQAYTDEDTLAQIRWSELLAQMDSARIATIHGLCGDILRANAAQIGLDPGFEVLDEIDAALLLDDVVADILRNLADVDDPNLELLYDEYDARIIHTALTDANLLNAIRDVPPSKEEIATDWDDLWHKKMEQFCSEFIRRCADIDEASRDGTEFSKTMAFMHDLNRRYATPPSQTQFLEDAMALVKRKSPGAIPKNWLDIGDDLKQKFGETKEFVKAQFKLLTGDQKGKTLPLLPSQDPLNQRAIALILAWYAVMNAVREQYATEKKRVGLLDFNDLEALTAELLTIFPDVRARYLNNEFNHVLVDEFQDTNKAQWEIVSALSDLDKEGSLFIVGDLKQSIYSFRGADVRVFNQVQSLITAHPKGEPIALSQSFRSHQALIDCFNTFFANYMQPDAEALSEVQIQYEAMSAHRQELPDYAPIDVLMLRDYPTSTDGEKLNADDCRQWEAYEIGRYIQNMIHTHQKIHDKTTNTLRPVTYGDFALLFRRMTHVTDYEDVFKAMGIQYVTVSGRGYYNRPEIWDLLNVLKALNNHTDNLALASALHSPLFNVSDEGLYILRRYSGEEAGHSLWRQLASQSANPSSHLIPQDRQAIQRAYGLLTRLTQLSGRMRISQLLGIVVAETGYLATLNTLPNGVQRRRNVEKLIEIAEASQRISLGDFTRYLNELTDREVRESEAALDTAGAVQLMTVHASKGLEFPVVIIPDAHYARQADSAKVMVDGESRIVPTVYDHHERKHVPSFGMLFARQRDMDREAAENKRLFYVAATRARDKLVLSGAITGKHRQAKGWFGAFVTWLMTQNDDFIVDDYAPKEPIVIQDDKRHVVVHLPEHQRDAINDLLGHTMQVVDWAMVQDTPTTPVATPPNLTPLLVQPTEYLYHLAASELATIGGYQYGNLVEREQHQQRIRHKLLSDQAPLVKVVNRTMSPLVTRRVVGDIVHEALRYWQFPQDTPDMERILDGYAWQFHIVDAEQRADAVQQAIQMLNLFRQKSMLYADIESAHQASRHVYKELPFIYNTGMRIIHGVIDVLYEKAAGHWAIADYKTSAIRPATQDSARQHARRYHLQVGAYAAATLLELGDVMVDVSIHYLRDNITVDIPTATWRADLAQLEHYIGEIITA